MNFEEFKSSIKNLNFLAKGWRANIFVGEFEEKVLSFKVSLKDYTIKALQKEAQILSYLYNFEGFPKVFMQGGDFFAYLYIDALPFEKVFPKLDDYDKRYILRQILEKAYFLDNLGIKRDEFQKEYKNVLIDKDKRVYILDFERGSFSKNPSNVPQFIQSLRVKGFLDKERAIYLGKLYKKENKREEVFLELLSLIT